MTKKKIAKKAGKKSARSKSAMDDKLLKEVAKELSCLFR